MVDAVPAGVPMEFPAPTKSIGNLHIPVEVSMDVLVSFSGSSGSEAMSSLLTELNDDSGIFLVIPIGLLRATGSMFFLSFTGGDNARLVAPSHCDAAWAAVQHGITAAFAFEALQAAVEGVSKRASQVGCCAYRSHGKRTCRYASESMGSRSSISSDSGDAMADFAHLGCGST